MVYVLLALSVPAAVILAVRLCLLKKTAREITSALPQKPLPKCSYILPKRNIPEKKMREQRQRGRVCPERKPMLL